MAESVYRRWAGINQSANVLGQHRDKSLSATQQEEKRSYLKEWPWRMSLQRRAPSTLFPISASSYMQYCTDKLI